MYKPPKTDANLFSSNLIGIINRAWSVKGCHPPELIIGIDHNMDLIKGLSHSAMHKFMEDVSNLNLLLTITRPTRITNHSTTLIDNIYVSENLHRSFESSIIIDDMSDHLPLLAMVKQTKILNKEPLTFKSRCLNDDKLKDVNHKLMRKNWIGLLTGTMSDDKFNQFCEIVECILDEEAPIKTV